MEETDQTAAVEQIHAHEASGDRRSTADKMRVMMMSYEGPLPPPAVMEAYNRIVPNGAERIFTVFEAQASHRQYLEKRVIETNTALQYLGFAAAFILSMTVIIGGFWLTYLGKSVEGIVAIVGALVALIGVFIYQHQTQTDERREKRKKVQGR